MNKKLHRSGRGNTKPGLNDVNSDIDTKGRHRSWCFTSYDICANYFNEDQMSYLVVGREVCPTTGREHLQCFVNLHNAKTFSSVKKLLGNEVHIEMCRGSAKQNIAYCTKDENYQEFGKKPSQGNRSDLKEVAQKIAEGTPVIELALEDPMLYHQYGRTLNMLEDYHMSKKYRTHMTTCTWYYGSTGTGKSERAFKDFHPDKYYVLPKDKGWWDGYRQQETVIINDFRGHIPYDELLQMIDRYPYDVSRRGRQPLPFTSRHVIITSSLTPEEVYHNRMENDCIEQLLRRVKVVNCLGRNFEIELN